MDWLARLHPQAALADSAARPLLPPRFADAGPAALAARAPGDGPAMTSAGPAASARAPAASASKPPATAGADPSAGFVPSPRAAQGPWSGRPSAPPAGPPGAAPNGPAAAVVTPGWVQALPADSRPATAAVQTSPAATRPARPEPAGASPPDASGPTRRPAASPVAAPASPWPDAGPAALPWPAASGSPGAPLQQATRLAAGPTEAAAESPWVVQVHIQHLEVRAPASNARRTGPAPRPAPPAGVSLADYLRGRRGGAA